MTNPRASRSSFTIGMTAMVQRFADGGLDRMWAEIRSGHTTPVGLPRAHLLASGTFPTMAQSIRLFRSVPELMVVLVGRLLHSAPAARSRPHLQGAAAKSRSQNQPPHSVPAARSRHHLQGAAAKSRSQNATMIVISGPGAARSRHRAETEEDVRTAMLWSASLPQRHLHARNLVATGLVASLSSSVLTPAAATHANPAKHSAQRHRVRHQRATTMRPHMTVIVGRKNPWQMSLKVNVAPQALTSTLWMLTTSDAKPRRKI